MCRAFAPISEEMRVALQAQTIYTILISLTLLAGCARPSQDQVAPGGTSVSVLTATLGEPAHTWTPNLRPQAKLLDYPDGCSYQVERDIVVGISCLPVGSEVTLQYWRHKWVGDSQRFEELPGSANMHGQKRYQLASKQAGMAVVYDEATESVLRVVRYEKH